MIGQSLFSKLRQDDQYHVRQARNDDWEAIEKLLYGAHRHHLALEWWTIQEWVGRPTLLLSIDRYERPVGLMLTVINNGPVAWLRVVAATSDECLKPLLDASVQVVLKQGGTGLAFLGNERWILSKLKQASFQQVNQVVTLHRRGTRPVPHGPSDLEVRWATMTDIDNVLTVDHAAFSPMWWYSHKILSRALHLAQCFHVAYLHNECVGYQFSTLRNKRGHIVRLATHPRWQNQGIGGRLLSEALMALDQAGAKQITVNTQEDNLDSLSLYRRFRFDRVGKPWSVWFRSLV